MSTQNLKAGVLGKKFWKKFRRKYKLVEYDKSTNTSTFVNREGKQFSISADWETGFVEITRESQTEYLTLYVDMYDVIAPYAVKRAVELLLEELDEIFRGDESVCDKSSKGNRRESREDSSEIIQEVLQQSSEKRSNNETRK